ncbi:MAG: hypothetical protein H9W81_12420 [Enterococcus sp.]|nr:hypothetical protein [Enterococcus sp.]
MAKSRKNKVRKVKASDRKAQIHMRRRNPSFRNHEKRSREEVELAIEYLTLTVNDEDRAELLTNHADTLERMGGIEGIHEFLDMLDGLQDNYTEKLDDNGWLTVRAISPEGIDFALQNEEDKAKAISSQ